MRLIHSVHALCQADVVSLCHAIWIRRCEAFAKASLADLRVVAMGLIPPKNKGKLGIFGPPRPTKDMPTPCPYIIIQWTEQGTAAFGRGHLWC